MVSDGPTSTPARRGIPILAYHSISDRPTPGLERWTLDPHLFRSHLQFLAAAGYSTVTISDLVAALAQRKDLGLAVALTFDDGFADFGRTAVPILAESRMCATLYVPTSFVGGNSTWLSAGNASSRRVMSWTELRAAVSSAVVECGSHGHRHLQLDRLRPSECTDEVRRPKAILEDQLQREVATFAYPFGFHNRRTRRAVHAEGYRSACAVGQTTANAVSDPYALPRFTVTRDTDLARLAYLLKDHAGLRDRASSEVKRLAWRQWRRVSSASGLLRRRAREDDVQV